MVKQERKKTCCIFLSGSIRKAVVVLCPKTPASDNVAEEGKKSIDPHNKAQNAAEQIELLCGRLTLTGALIAMFGILLTPTAEALNTPTPAEEPVGFPVVFSCMTFCAQFLAHAMLRYVRFQAFLGDPGKAFGSRRSSSTSGRTLMSKLTSSFASSVSTDTVDSDDADASTGRPSAVDCKKTVVAKVHPVG
jgi:hypothetical protein